MVNAEQIFDIISKLLAAIGGIGVIIIGVSKLLGQNWLSSQKEKRRKDTERTLERDRQLFGFRRVKADRWANDQFEHYRALWSSLQDLKTAGDALWKRVDEDTLSLFAYQLKETESDIDRGAIFFEQEDLVELKDLLHEFGQFGRGKMKVYEIRSHANFSEFDMEALKEQIRQNRNHMNEYYALMERVLKSFRKQLSSVEAV